MSDVDGDSGTLLLATRDTGRSNDRPKEPWEGELVKSVVYGGHDAIVSCFSLIASMSGSRHSAVDVLVLGFANLAADAISMGFGEYVSSSGEKDVAFKEMAVTEWDVNHHSFAAQMELLRHYLSLGMDFDDAKMVVGKLAKYGNILADEKIKAEKGMLPPDQEEEPWKNSLVTVAAFLVFGCVPLLSFIVLIPFTQSESAKFLGACVLSVLSLVLLGLARGRIARERYGFSVAMTLLNGGVAGAAAYILGMSLRNAVGTALIILRLHRDCLSFGRKDKKKKKQIKYNYCRDFYLKSILRTYLHR